MGRLGGGSGRDPHSQSVREGNAQHLLSRPSAPALKFQKQWLAQPAVSTRNAGPCTPCAPQPPAGGTWRGQGKGADEDSGQKLPSPQARRAVAPVPAGQKWPLGQGAQVIAPGAGAWLPGAHWVQLEAPGALEKCPWGQRRQGADK